MYKVKFTNKFKKSYKLMKKRGYDMSLLNDIIDALRQGKTLAEKYLGLPTAFIGYYECHIKPDWLLIYLVEDDIMTLSLINTGSHSDLF